MPMSIIKSAEKYHNPVWVWKMYIATSKSVLTINRSQLSTRLQTQVGFVCNINQKGEVLEEHFPIQQLYFLPPPSHVQLL